MYEDPENDERSAERASDPLVRAREKFDEFRMHAELAAIFEGPRKFDAEIRVDLDAELAREIQKNIGQLEKSRSVEHPILPPDRWDAASRILSVPAAKEVSTNDYHIYRRPGEALIVRWLAGPAEIDAFYERFQAHFEAALAQFRDEERQQHGWKKDNSTLKYLDALDKIDVKMADRYLRPIIQDPSKLGVKGLDQIYILSTQTADEMDVLHLCDYLMGASAEQVVGRASAPPEEEATEQDRAWFFKLFSLRGRVDGEERMCFFTYLQKTDDSGF